MDEITTDVRLQNDKISEAEQLHIDSIQPERLMPEYRTDLELLENQKDDESKKPWSIPGNIDITAKGRRIVGLDPNVCSETLKALLASESKLITPELEERMFSFELEELVKREFFSGKEIGIAHLSQCIKEDFQQTKADLIGRYSDDRRIPFVVGAYFINAYMRFYKLSYFQYRGDAGYVQTAWSPRTVFVQPKTILPPRRRELKKYSNETKKAPIKLPDCPLCGSPAKILRLGRRGKKVHACCLDPKGECNWYLGTTAVDTEEEAAAEWLRICSNAEVNKDEKC